MGDVDQNGRWAPAKEPLALIYTCQQLYQETALLPFALNDLDIAEFAHLNLEPFLGFLGHLSRGQRTAVNTLKISIFYPNFFVHFGHIERAEIKREVQDIVDRLQGLDRIIIATNQLEMGWGGRNEDEKACDWIHKFTAGRNIAVNVVFQHRSNIFLSGVGKVSVS